MCHVSFGAGSEKDEDYFDGRMDFMVVEGC